MNPETKVKEGERSLARIWRVTALRGSDARRLARRVNVAPASSC
jgi:hypothetical protein